MGLKHKVTPSVVTHIVSSNYNAFIKSKHELLHPINFKADITGTLIEKYNFIDFIQLIQYNLPWQLLPRLQMSQHIQHEYHVVMIIECVKTRLVHTPRILESESFMIVH